MRYIAIPILAYMLVLAGCSDGKQQSQVQADNAAVANAVAPQEIAPAAKDIVIDRKDEVLEYSYSWPAVAAAIAPLNQWLQSHSDDQYAKWRKMAEEAQKDARTNDFPFTGYSYQQNWSAVADTPQVLVMEAQGYEFTGGAHGMPFTVSMIWDKAAGRRLAIKDVLDIGALEGLVGDAFCKELDRQRAEKRGGNAKLGGTIAEFDECVAITDGEIMPISKNGKALDMLRVVIGPYAAGPYAEGSYEIELPVDAALIAAVKPAYRGWFGTP